MSEEGINRLLFSPDGESIGYWSVDDSKLKRISIVGGIPQQLCKDPSPAYYHWGTDGTAMLEDADDVSIGLCKRVLAATHNEAPYPTVYSNVYDLKRRIVYLYHFHNFQNEVVIDLKAELAKGAHRLDLPDLFPKTFVEENFKYSSMNPSGIAQIMPTLVLLIIIPIVLVMAILQIIAFWKICTRIGMHGALGLLILVPFGRVILPLYIAFAKWPALEHKPKENTDSL